MFVLAEGSKQVAVIESRGEWKSRSVGQADSERGEWKDLILKGEMVKNRVAQSFSRGGI